MKITFYGVRGSVPTPGATTLKYGGNTSCTHVQLADGTHFVFDAGTGIRVLGQQLKGGTDDIHVLITHNHWDHIQGFPYFDPIFDENRPIHIVSQTVAGYERLPVFQTVSGPFHPVEFEDLAAVFHQHALPATPTQFQLGGATITTKLLNHPNGGCAYRLDAEGVSIAYVTDNELNPPEAIHFTGYEEWLAYLRDVDVLIHDAQYTEQDMPLKHGWGHSLVSQVLNLAADAGVKAVCLYSHDPLQSDEQLDVILAKCQAELQQQGKPQQVYCAAEGQTLTVSPETIRSN